MRKKYASHPKIIIKKEEFMAKQLNFRIVDLGVKKILSTKIALLQIKSPDIFGGWEKRRDRLQYSRRKDDLLAFLDDDFRMPRKIVDTQVERINSFLDRAIKDGAGILCLPNMVIPEDMNNEFQKITKEMRVVIISGFEYICDKKQIENIIKIYFPSGDNEFKVVTYNKVFESKYDPEIVLGNEITIYVNSGFGNFVVLNCFDYTNMELLNNLSKFALEKQTNIDIIFVISHNPAFRMFHNYGMADSHRFYCYIALVNSGDFGGSAIYAPIRKEGHLNIHNYLQGLYGKGEGIIVQDIDARDLNASRIKTIPGWMDPPMIDIDDNFDIETIELDQTLRSNRVRIAIVELQAPEPEAYMKNNWRFRKEYRNRITNKVKDLLEELENKADFIIFPEVSLPEGIEETLFHYSKRNSVYIMGGFEYSEDTKNVCKIFTPHVPNKEYFLKKDILYGTKDTIHYFRYTKIFRSKYDHPSMRKGNKLLLFKNSLFGNFSPIICFDYSHSSVLERLTNKIDLLFVSSYNPDVEIYNNYGQADCHRLFCYIIQCNVPKFGGSAIYGPIRYIDKVRTNSILGQLIGSSKDETRILRVEVEINSLRLREKSLRFNFYSPPAGYARSS